jgi:hypothetical protein
VTHPAGQSDLSLAWSARLDSLEIDMRRLETFLIDVAEVRVEGQDARRRGMAFVSAEEVPQGVFYSVGWFMGATVERQLGRDAVIAATCDHGRLLLDYQRAATLANSAGTGDPIPVWSDRLFRVLELDPR